MATGLSITPIVIDFGAFPGKQEVSYNITGQSGITSTQSAQAEFMAEATSDHTIADHTYAPMFVFFSCGNVIAGTGFTIYARAVGKMQGTFNVRWVWA